MAIPSVYNPEEASVMANSKSPAVLQKCDVFSIPYLKAGLIACFFILKHIYETY
ncbi:MAG: hypothetical protein IPP39_00020 [Chitinophagaceae bacterium]|nr:hypothetical protein [Chitinophagaceae bacterium]